MSAKSPYGQPLASALHVGRTPTLLTHTSIADGGIAVSEIRRDVPEYQYSSPVRRENAFLVTLNVREWSKRILWIDDKPVRAQPLPVGTSNIFDLRRKYIGYGVSPFHMLSFYLPRAVLDRIADLDNRRRVDELGHDPSVGLEDPVIRELGIAMHPAFAHPEEANLLFLEHITSAIAAHTVQKYGRGKVPIFEKQLTLTQQSRAKELICSDLRGSISTLDLARECGLTLTGFRRAFSNTIGVSPHRWLLEQRIERAMKLSRYTRLSFATIAFACGFNSERHLARVFVQHLGLTPAAWRSIVIS
jgi:AraC family transcriptional regulator